MYRTCNYVFRVWDFRPCLFYFFVSLDCLWQIDDSTKTTYNSTFDGMSLELYGQNPFKILIERYRIENALKLNKTISGHILQAVISQRLVSVYKKYIQPETHLAQMTIFTWNKKFSFFSKMTLNLRPIDFRIQRI